MHKLSAVLITLNEINCIDPCIDSISFADEIIVVDSYSTDGTWEYLNTHDKVKASQRVFKNYTDQKSNALSLTSHNWVLFVDADEIITEESKNEILSVLKNPKADAYYIFRKFIMNNKPLKYCGFQTDKQLRLFDKRKAHFAPDRLVHEHLVTIGSSRILTHKLDHHFYKSYNDYSRRILFYGQLKGLELYRKNKKPNLFLRIIKPSFKFFYMFFVRFGILDGSRGFTIAKINAKGVLERYKHLKKLIKEHKN
ncbi:alpha-L-glycero-D-manno-heptose beta-1,4-glucosyltransferase [Neptunitalea chrysea]|uniref:Alpha-L-glycero-D-manno-heptose beta-1,4-glucosyltransferase n=1 Tax=Neptunitalea chrysea TaxID=1647581 RepID=A0A9W6B8J2_9FLAO|nr:glycosyltransferase family 2 protein [Neptunitalea chrysea]GLB53562.1 alpha-L-glycero-D-manno-heptose beta-1,4-glucosyltransferase [Neptunitalea chrysea]